MFNTCGYTSNGDWPIIISFDHTSRCKYVCAVPALVATEHRLSRLAVAGLTRHRWTVADILLMPVPEEVWLAPLPAI